MVNLNLSQFLPQCIWYSYVFVVKQAKDSGGVHARPWLSFLFSYFVVYLPRMCGSVDFLRLRSTEPVAFTISTGRQEPLVEQDENPLSMSAYIMKLGATTLTAAIGTEPESPRWVPEAVVCERSCSVCCFPVDGQLGNQSVSGLARSAEGPDEVR